MTKDKTEDKGELMVLKDPERGGAIVAKSLQREVTKLAEDMGLDIRLGHIMILGGKPYVGKSGLQYLMQRKEGPGIKSLNHRWIVDDWKNQHFVVEAVIETDAGDVYHGEGDAVGVPVDELMRLDQEAIEKKLTSKERKQYIMQGVENYPLKNVTSFIAIKPGTARRMAMTRAFNRAASIAAKVVLPTAEEHVLVQEYDQVTDADYQMLDGEKASKEQVKKIMEFHKSDSPGVKDLFAQHLEYGQPDTWDRDVAGDFLKRVIEIREAERAKAKEEAEVIEGTTKEVEPEKEAKKPKDEKPPMKGKGQTGLDTK